MNLYRSGSVSQRIMERAEALPEATPLCPKAFLDLGTRAAVDQALSRLAREERLDRIYPGVYMRTISTRFGLVSPDLSKALDALAKLWGEVIVLNGGAAANVLGFITQFMLVPTFLTSGRDRTLNIGGKVRLFHAPSWQLVLPGRPAGTVIRAVSWLEREDVRENMERVKHRLSSEDQAELLAARAVLPTWMAEPVGAVFADA